MERLTEAEYLAMCPPMTPEARQRELERLRSRARHNEAAALRHAAEVEREKWQGVVAEKDTEIARLRAFVIADL